MKIPFWVLSWFQELILGIKMITRKHQYFDGDGLKLFSEVLREHCSRNGVSPKDIAALAFKPLSKTFLYNLSNAWASWTLEKDLEFTTNSVNPVRVIHLGGLLNIPGSDTLTLPSEAILDICRGRLTRGQMLFGPEHKHPFSKALVKKRGEATWAEVCQEIGASSPFWDPISPERLETLYLLGGWSINPLEAMLVGTWLGSQDQVIRSLLGNPDFHRGSL